MVDGKKCIISGSRMDVAAVNGDTGGKYLQIDPKAALELEEYR